MSKKIKMPRKEFVRILRHVAEHADLYTNEFGTRTGWDANVNKEFDGIHEFLLTAKRKKAEAAEKMKEGEKYQKLVTDQQ